MKDAKGLRRLGPFSSHAMILFLTILLAMLPAQQRQDCSQGSHTLYSRHATSLDQVQTLTSPDRTKVLKVTRIDNEKTDSHLRLEIKAGREPLIVDMTGFNGEALWAPDSKAFAITLTTGGGGFGSQVYVFYVEDTKVRRINVSRIVERVFRNPGKCEFRVKPNTAAVEWLQGSARLLVAAEVVPVSVCECRGTFQLYEVSVPTLVIEKSYSQLQAKQKFGALLGCELLNADDKCARMQH